MVNLEEFVPEIEQIREQYRNCIENELLVQRRRLLEIMGNFFGVEWDSQGEMTVKDQSLESEKMDDFVSYYEKIDEIGIKDVSLLSREEVERDIEELIDIFYKLQEESLLETEEESVSDEEIITDDEEIL